MKNETARERALERRVTRGTVVIFAVYDYRSYNPLHSYTCGGRYVYVYTTSVRATVSPCSRKYRRGRRASRAPGDPPAAGTLPSSHSRLCSEGSARRYWPSARAGPGVVLKAITWGSSAADCNPLSRVIPSECRPPNQVRDLNC